MDNSTGPSSVFPTVVGMSTRQAFRISSSGIEGLGHQLANIADYLEVAAHYTRDGSQETYGFPTVTGWGAMDTVLGDYELLRKQLCTHLRELRRAAKGAGAVYVTTESYVQGRHRGIL